MMCDACRTAGHEVRKARLVETSTISPPTVRKKKLLSMLERAVHAHKQCDDPKTCTCQHMVPMLV